MDFSLCCSKVRLSRIIVLLFLLIGVLVGSLLIYERATRPPYYSLQPGMTMEEVRSIMGPPCAELAADPEGTHLYYVFARCRGRVDLHLVFQNQRLTGTTEKSKPWSDPLPARVVDALWD
jgi:hypothetical protein